MKIAYVIYPDFTALDLIGPYEVISLWPDVELHWVATTTSPVSSDHGLTVLPTTTPAQLPDPDVVVIPGSSKPLGPLDDQALLDWVRQVAPTATWLASACTGSGVYGAAGVLAGRRATTHWAFRENLKAMGVDVVANRVVFDGKFVTGAGVSAGIDMALALTARVHGDELAKAIQLGIEYDPEPIFDSGSPDKAAASTLRLSMRMLMGDTPLRTMGQSSRRLVGDRLRRLRRA
ncbi:DJ-1/PfpI family protein [Baekduia sp.]|uniref:DJ-1/PfpI family protein n=1 Tax=Baekduia sp. TaxID=2600305 RepID=UPI002DFD8D32|nr:DJ-1/PfpI family protein [Baekduia sp.]